jgi:hypothetical protein
MWGMNTLHETPSTNIKIRKTATHQNERTGKTLAA